MTGGAQAASAVALKETPLSALHRALGAKMVPFAGYAMPVQYPAGIMAEHLHARAGAALFDVSHMGQIELAGGGADLALEALVPADLLSLKPWAIRYTQFTTASGGIIDDLMVTRTDAGLGLVVNASRKDVDLDHLRASLPGRIGIEPKPDRALLALQGPSAAGVLARFAPGIETMRFMTAARVTLAGFACSVSRSGYTGEDGFEISLAAGDAEALARRLLAQPEVKPAGLGARDSLRLEAGLCLYGHDINETTSPVEAGLVWSIGKRRLADGGFPGTDRIRAEMAKGPARRRVGIRPEGRVIAREGTDILGPGGETLGRITSGGFGPSVDGPIAMGYVAASVPKDAAIQLAVRGQPRPGRIASLPFVPSRYFRG
ncbi:MAG: glycine cleavage system aminomethyltransferase GcvT [Alphaproteobacteria bacterium]